MRTVAIVVIIVALALIIFGLIAEALAWLIVLGLIVLVIGAVVGWLGMRRAGQVRGGRSRS